MGGGIYYIPLGSPYIDLNKTGNLVGTWVPPRNPFPKWHEMATKWPLGSPRERPGGASDARSGGEARHRAALPGGTCQGARASRGEVTGLDGWFFSVDLMGYK